MNEEANTRVVREGYEKFGSSDVPGLLTLFHDDISWTTPKVENASFSGKRKGLEAVGEFFAQLNDAEEFSRFEPTEFIAQGDKVVVLGSSTSNVKSTGRNLDLEWVHVFTLREGKVAGFQEYFDSAAANKAFQKTAAANE